MASNLTIEDKNRLVTLLLKRMCNFDEAILYLLDVIPESEKDSLLEELMIWSSYVGKPEWARLERLKRK